MFRIFGKFVQSQLSKLSNIKLLVIEFGEPIIKVKLENAQQIPSMVMSTRYSIIRQLSIPDLLEQFLCYAENTVLTYNFKFLKL